MPFINCSGRRIACESKECSPCSRYRCYDPRIAPEMVRRLGGPGCWEKVVRRCRRLPRKQKPPGCEARRLFLDCVCLHSGLVERTELRANQGGQETPSIFQISPVRVTKYAVFPMNSSE